MILSKVQTFNQFIVRCMIRDVAVKVPKPDDFIAEFIFPSYIILPRCSGREGGGKIAIILQWAFTKFKYFGS